MKKIQLLNNPLTIIFVFFALLYASISLVNHYNFRTFGWDLGINNNAIFDYAHFRWNDCMIMQPAFDNVLSDHFSLYPIIVSPFYWIFGSWTMLIFQIVAILFGGFGIYRFVRRISDNEWLARLAVLHFFTIWGIFSALSFDYHDNVVATMFVPWFLDYFEQKKWKQSILFFILIMIAKENMALWAVFIGLGLALRAALNKDRKKLIFSLGLSFLALVYFVLVIKVFIPSLATPGRDYLHNSFNALGSNFGEVLINIVKHPIRTIELLFVNHHGDAAYDGIKAETYLALILAGGFALILAPEYFIMIIPIVAQKMFNDLPIRWGISVHYSIEFAPILVLALYAVIHRFGKRKIQIASLCLSVSVISSISFLDHRTSEYYNKENSQFYKKAHWIRDFDVSEVRHALDKIPADARVSAQSHLCPHLALREFIFHYPFIGNANYIALLPKEGNKYPLDEKSYDQKIEEFISSGDWEYLVNRKSIIILKKKKLELGKRNSSVN
jgi:uncharacterized membrane protein